MEQYCITLGQAKKLVELGFERPCGFVWLQFRNTSSPVEQHQLVHTVLESIYNDYEEREYLKDLVDYPAYHVGELGEMLPDTLYKYPDYYWLSFSKYDNGGWEAYYEDRCEISSGMMVQPIFGQTEAIARGAMLIYLLEHKLL